MNTKWMCGFIFAALVVAAVLPVITLAGNDECFDCMSDCDEEYQWCLDDCEGLEPDLLIECRADCRRDYIQCNTWCRWESCTKE